MPFEMCKVSVMLAHNQIDIVVARRIDFRYILDNKGFVSAM